MKTNLDNSTKHKCLGTGFSLMFLLIFGALVGCKPATTPFMDTPISTMPTFTLSVLPKSTLTPSPIASSTIVKTATTIFDDFRKNLIPGTYVVYWSQNTNTWEVKGLGGTSKIKLIPNITSEVYTEIKPSYDGNLVAFSNTAGQVSVYNLHTGKLDVYSNPGIRYIYNFQWMPDNQTLLYTGTPEYIWWYDALVGIYGIVPKTGKSFTVSSLANEQFKYGLHGLTLSKDGRWLAFYAPRLSEFMSPDPEFAVYLMDTVCLQNVDTCGESIQFVGDGHNPAWSPDGKLGWVCSDGNQLALCQADVAALAYPKVILKINDLIALPDAKFYDFSWSPDGKYIAINLQKYQPTKREDITDELFIVPTGGGQPVKVSSATEKNERWLRWSPDSKYLAYSRTLGYTEQGFDHVAAFPITDLYLYDIQTGEKLDLVDNPGDREEFGFFIIVK